MRTSGAAWKPPTHMIASSKLENAPAPMAARKLRCSAVKIGIGCLCILLVAWILLDLHIPVLDSILYFPPERSGSPINYPESFQYLLNSEVCQHGGEPVEAVIVVHSDPRHPEVRDAIRRSLSQEFLMSLGLRRAFMLADASEAFVEEETTISQAVIDEENRQYRDIVQGNFHDSYHNLTYKHIMALDWANTFCSQARMIIKMDDDIVYDVYEILDLVKRAPGRNYLGGQVFKTSVPFREGTKWRVSKDVWPRKYYPPYLSGWLYLVSPDVSRGLVLQSTIVPFFWIDDTFVTGILAERLPITITSLRELYVTSEECVQYTANQQFSLSEPARSKVYKPSFVIGPSGKDVKTIEHFNELTRYCHKYTCHARVRSKLCVNIF